MYLKQFYDPFLSQFSYIIGCQTTRKAIVIDPLRDIEQYIKAAKLEQYDIIAATETHIHADFLSGCRLFGELENIKLYLSGEGGSDWQYGWVNNIAGNFQLLKHDDVINIGTVEIKVIHTPGHTPEHISFMVTDGGAEMNIPMGVITGDFVFVGDLGRPDLLESVVGIKESSIISAGQLYDSVKSFIELPEYLQVWPCHGVGSACGKEMGAVPESTVGYEKRLNKSILAINDGKDSFINSILVDQDDPPLYFKKMKYINRDTGAGPPNEIISVPLNTNELIELLKDDSLKIIDSRQDRVDFMTRHIPGSIHIPLNKSFPKSAGSYISADDGVVVVVDIGEDFQAVYNTLLRIGIDNIRGFILIDTIDKLTNQSINLSEIKTVNFEELIKMKGGSDGKEYLIVDVRNKFQFGLNHIPDAVNIPYTTLIKRQSELPGDSKIFVHCTTGNTASGATSMLKRNGFNVVYIDDAWANYEHLTNFDAKQEVT